MDSSVIDHFSSSFTSAKADQSVASSSVAIDHEQQELDKWVRDYMNEASSIQDFETFFMLNNQEWVRVERASRFNHQNVFDDIEEDHFWNQDWIKTQGLLRLCQSVINQLDTPQVDPLKYQQLFEQFFAKSTLPTSDIVPKLLDLIEPVCNTSWNIFRNNSVKHRNVCLVLSLVLDCFGHERCKVMDQSTCDQILEYLIRIIEDCDSMETILYAVLTVEKIYIKQSITEEDLRKRLIAALYRLASNLNQCPVGKVTTHDYDPHPYQVGFCSNWFLHQLLLSSNTLPQIPPVKLSPDRLCARSDTTRLFTVRSAYPVRSSGVYYYEVILLTGGPMRIGWSIKETQLAEYSILGAHPWCIAVDGCNECFWSAANSMPLDSPHHWQAGDVVGCLIDTEAHRFSFYLNGGLIKFNSKSVPFSTEYHYYASVLLFPYQQVYFNFGQVSFKFPPSNEHSRELQTFHSSNPILYRLAESTFAGIDHTGKEFVHFDDYNQEHFGRLLTNLCKVNGKWTNLEDEPMFKSECALQRLCQFMINNADSGNSCDNYSHYSGLFSALLFYIEEPKSSLMLELSHMLDPLMNAYLDLYATDWAKHRQVCLIWLILAEKYCDLLEGEVVLELMAYLMRLLDKCDHDYDMLLYALLDVEILLLKVKSFDTFKEDTRKRLIDSCCRLATNNDYASQDVLNLNYYSYQVGFCARWLLEHVLLLPKSYLPSVKLFTDRLSARFDGLTCRKTIHSAFGITSGLYYYEVILLTGGPVRVGWFSGEPDDLSGELLNKDSICFDGHLQRVWHGGKSINLNETKWKAGDVIGCLLDLIYRKAVFYLNGKPINYQVAIEQVTRPRPYFASAVLFPHQHCIFNFGQYEFLYPPKDSPKFNSFYQESNSDILKYQISQQHELESNVSEELPNNKRFHLFLEELKMKISEPNYDRKYFHSLPKRFDSLLCSTDHGVYHLFDSLLSPHGSIMADRLDVFTRWVQQNVTACADRLSYLELFWAISSRMESYLHLRATDQVTTRQQLHLCLGGYLFCKIMIDNTLIRNDNLNLSYFATKVEGFVLRVLQQQNPNNLWCQYFAIQILSLLCCHHESVKTQIRKNETLRIKLSRLARYSDNCSLTSVYEPNFESLSFQTGYCASSLLRHFDRCHNSLLEQQQQQQSSTIEPYQLTARCDQSHDSQCFLSTFFVPKTGVYFYEVILLSGGSMRIGWATAESELGLFAEVGDDRHSVGLDLHQRVIWHNGKPYRVRKGTPTWTAGDVVGCLINVSDRKFCFYLNGVQVTHKWRLFRRFTFSTSSPYYIAISLTAHQQCCFNLGATECPFRYPPRGIPYQGITNNEDTKLQFNPLQCEQCHQLPPTDQCVQCESVKFCIKCSTQSKELLCRRCLKYPTFLNGPIN